MSAEDTDDKTKPAAQTRRLGDTKMSNKNWNTYSTTGYTHDVANDHSSAGGVHLHQVRQTRAGNWQKRICQSNGRHQSYGEVSRLSVPEGEALFARASMW